ncbi:hypothetical protein [Subtercola vilae]|uniref:Uncharacterized protein n=1 Tax=Subtercola vilae TaxID=2056433 RepID=A0A4T2BWQ4_9MICO|nr:hypothetical protein [Subtercola vilae]TIH34981.1 hypothetical protein D4765_11855 [Subtercola vilae]
MTVQTVPAFLQNAALTNANVFRNAAAAPFARAGILGGGELGVLAQTTPNMTVKVNAGRAKVAGTSVSPPAGFTFTTQGFYDVFNDAAISVTIAASNSTQPRIDVVYVQVEDSFYAGTNNDALIAVATGYPASSPTVPAIPANSLALGQVAVGANVTSIVSANIVNVAPLAALLGASIVRDYSQFINTGSTATHVALSAITLPAVPVASRALIKFDGSVGFSPQNETIGVAIAVSAGTLTSAAPYTILVATATWARYGRQAYVDIPANTVCAITLFSEADQPSYYSLIEHVHVALAGEFM